MRLSLLILLFPFYLFSQERASSDSVNRGVQFVHGLTWQQILNKAKEENKFVFVDCYATWCNPCRWMDKYVYSNSKAGDFFNNKFISVRVQMDTTKNDDEYVKQWYYTAKKLRENYEVNGFPTFLFFSRDGQAVHKNAGRLSIPELINTAKMALNPNTQYFTLLNEYKTGKVDYSNLGTLALQARNVQQYSLADSIANDYINNYLLQLKPESLFKKGNIEFIASFIGTIDSKAFNIFYRQHNSVDSIMNKQGYAESVVDYLIYKERVLPLIKQAEKEINVPDWKKISIEIKTEFNSSYAQRNIVNAKIKWYGAKKDWNEWAKYTVQKVEKYGPGPLGLNVDAWSLFLYSNDKKTLSAGIKWINSLLKQDPENAAYLDTYANLLYKSGETKKAIQVEQNAKRLDAQQAMKKGQQPNKTFQETIDKMVKREPTWPTSK